MKIHHVTLLLLVCGVVSVSAADVIVPEGMLTIKTVDQSGAVIEGASVAIYSDVYGKNKVVQKTLVEGLASGKLRAFGSLFYSAGKEGYYPGSGKYLFEEGAMKGSPIMWATRRWEPWNPTVEVVLKKKGQPVAMYVKRRGILTLPEQQKSIGYDLQAGDWNPPHGKGAVADLIFTGNGAARPRNYQLQWTFSNPGDGIQVVPDSKGPRSELKSPKEAPIGGYAPSILIDAYFQVVGADGTVGEKPACFIFRVRTVLDEKGNVVSAHYGKMYPGGLKMDYYFNPEPNSQNLEWDVQRNLFPSTTEGYNDP